MYNNTTKQSLRAWLRGRAQLCRLLSASMLTLVFALLAVTRTSAQTYCTSMGTSNIYYIIDVTTTGGSTNISNTGTGYATNGYGDYTAMSVSALQGASFTLSSTAYLFTYKWGVWVDWNNDGDFDDLNETAYTYTNSTGLISISTPVTIPPGTPAGGKRMRVVVLRDWVTDPLSPCGTNYTEAEDYTVNVIASACSGAPNGGTTNAAATTVACNATTALSLTGNTSGNGITYQWQYRTGATWVDFGTNAATQTSTQVSQSTQFRCKITCTNPGGSSTTSAPVTVNTIPIPVNVGNDTTICPGITYNLNAGNAGATYAWNTGATTQSINVSTAGTYSVLVTLPSGCTGSDAINITAGVVPVNNLAATTNLCSGETANLNAGNTGSTFLWTPGGNTTQTINVTAGGTYQAKVTSVNGCILNTSTNVIIRPLPIANLGNDTAICDGDQITLNAGNPGYSFVWNTGATTQTINVIDSATYEVTITTPYGCKLTDDKKVAFLPSPRAEGFNFIPMFYEGLGTVKFSPLQPTNVMSYQWDFGDGSPLTTQVNPTHVYAAGGDYIVTLTVFNGCGQFSISLPINVDLTTGIVKLGKDAVDIILYPNPSRDYITIDNKTGGIKMEQVLVYNIVGSVVYNQAATSGSQHKLSVASFAPGIYTIKISTDKGMVIRKFEVLK